MGRHLHDSPVPGMLDESPERNIIGCTNDCNPSKQTALFNEFVKENYFGSGTRYFIYHLWGIASY